MGFKPGSENLNLTKGFAHVVDLWVKPQKAFFPTQTSNNKTVQTSLDGSCDVSPPLLLREHLFASHPLKREKHLNEKCLNEHAEEGLYVHLRKRKKRLHTHFKRLPTPPRLRLNPLSWRVSRPPCETCIKANRRTRIQASHSHRGIHASNSPELPMRSQTLCT